MYIAYCKSHSLRASILKLDVEAATAPEEKLREAILALDSTVAYDLLRCEAGVYRVQRVPTTETKGRTSTSAVSVLVLPSFPDTSAEDDSEAGFDDPASYCDPRLLVSMSVSHLSCRLVLVERSVQDQ